jgi:transposase
MARALSADFRDRVVAAIAGGLSRRQTAVRFDVSAASAVRWQQLASQRGTPTPPQQAGDRRLMRIEAHAELILKAYNAAPGITLSELQALLGNHGTEVALGTIWRFFARRGITRKKDARDRAGSPRHPEAARGMVRRPARSRSRAAYLHR